jgi:ribose/xylose/arabinose/galactoside ABC-type transport system permease subunit
MEILLMCLVVVGLISLFVGLSIDDVPLGPVIAGFGAMFIFFGMCGMILDENIEYHKEKVQEIIESAEDASRRMQERLIKLKGDK